MEMAMADANEPVLAPSVVDLDRLSDEEVLSLIIPVFDRLRPDQLAQAQNAILERRKVREEEVRNAFLVEMRERALELGISIESLFPGGKRRMRSDAGQILAPKYRGPNGETWSGRGRQPTWLTELEAVGHDKREFLIKAEE